ncbi:MAG: pitrilysin family protein [Bacteroidales bacterium]|nr:pitrilysin family protein [Bacteroidales bacterium]
MRVSEPRVTTAVLPNGLRMVHLLVPGAAAGYYGVAVRAGSRDEDDSCRGLAHFVEHTIFKGTARRSSWHIINRMEAVGGELNAYTTKEETVVYSVFPGGNASRAAELIADLVQNSRFPDRELDKEREVVADEIDSYLDSPSEAVYDDFEDLIFAGSSLGHNILGDRAALARFDSEACRDWLARYYVPGNMVMFYAGGHSAERVFELTRRYFGGMEPRDVVRHTATPAVVAPFERLHHIDSHQCHTLVGARTGGIDSDDRFARALFTNILGGPGMNSLLNVALRERRGLVYSVEASTGLFTDCGELVVYYGCDPDDNGRCRRLVRETIESVAGGAVTPRRLEMAKKQYLGQLTVASENVDNRILGMARQMLYRGHVTSRADSIARVNALTADDVSAFAASLLPLSSLTLGN